MEQRDAEPPPTASQLLERLRDPLAPLGLALGTREAERLAGYLALLLPWNARVNLTGARGAAEILERHLADAFALVAQLPPDSRRLVDVGAGAGFLGISAAILRPDLHCVLLEPIGKKHAFLRAVVRELALRNLEPRGERLEAHLREPGLAPYDVAVSQATWPPATWLDKARPLLHSGGLAVAFEGREPAEELPPGTRRLPYRVGARSGVLLVLAV